MKKILKFLVLSFLLLPAYANASDNSYKDISFYKLKFKNMDGKIEKGIKYKNNVVVFNFWGTWCPPCMKEMPSMEALKKRYGKYGLEIVAVNVGEPKRNVLDFFRYKMMRDFDFNLYLDENQTLFKKMGGKSFPTTFIVNRNGDIITKIVGGIDWFSPRNQNFILKLIKQK